MRIYPHSTAENIRSPVDFQNGLRVQVDLDAEEKRAARPGRENKHMVRISKAKNNKIYLSVVRDYLDGRCDFNDGILEGISKCCALDPAARS